jgi:hypothetical protein
MSLRIEAGYVRLLEDLAGFEWRSAFFFFKSFKSQHLAEPTHGSFETLRYLQTAANEV